MPPYMTVHDTYTEKELRKAQTWLKNLGSKIQINGRWSIGMQNALYSFQRKQKIPLTGELDQTTWKRLKHENSWWKRLVRRFCGHKK